MNGPVQTKQELIQIIRENRELILAHGVRRLGIFGSFVTGEANRLSDVDLFIHLDPEYKTLRNLVALSSLLKNILGRRVELVTPESLNKHIGPHIIRQVEYVPLAA